MMDSDGSGGQRVEKSLSYTIHAVSSYAQSYHPNRILEDNPNDPSSRWCSESAVPPQFLTLKLKRTAIVTEILFGKHRKSHVCNVKRVKVFGGMSEESMIELMDDILTNDSTAESFPLKHRIHNNDFPCRYVKIQPLQGWSWPTKEGRNRNGTHYNFTLWYVELRGIDDCTLVKDCLQWLTEYRQREAIRLCLKHLRQKNCSEAFESLQKRTRIQLEDRLLTRLHELLVIEGAFDPCERLLEEACDRRLFDTYIRRQDYRPIWKQLMPAPGPSGRPGRQPGMRGGHQMCIDPYGQVIYLFGGWDGSQDLADLWSYSITEREWTCISVNTGLEGGPTARSCHKMCLDPIRKRIYTLGRYLDSSIRSVDNLKSDFYVYDIQSNRWSLVCDDTGAVGGPALVFDHQMCIDLEKNTIYVFGGRVLSCLSDERAANCPELPVFSGLYIYEGNSGKWRKLRDDCPAVGVPQSAGSKEIKSRIGHSMLFHQKSRLLYVFAGQRQKEYLSDFFTYNVDTDEIVVINDGHKSEVPSAGFTQRATIDPETNEIHVLSGLNRDKDKDKERDKDADRADRDKGTVGASAGDEETVKNSFWVYDIPDNRWSCIYRNHSSLDTDSDATNNNNTIGTDTETTPTASTAASAVVDAGDTACGEPCQPCPRFAHQLVYDHIHKCHYLFGGNPGRNQSPKLRLDDFWTLELKRLSSEELLRKCRRLVREQSYREIIQRAPQRAIQYLQNQLSQTFDHSVPDESRAFQSLAALMFQCEEDTDSPNPVSMETDPPDDPNYRSRTKVFDTIVEYFPEDMTQPKANLVDLVLI